MKRILVVEDEKHLRENLKLNLELEGYELVAVEDGKSALKRVKEEHFDLVVLDVMLPEISGFEVCEKMRLDNRDLPVLFLTAKDSSEDVVKGLSIGGDDYLTKPFNLEEFLLRVRALLRRSSADSSLELSTYAFGSNEINFVTYEAEGLEGPFRLTNKEVKLLKLLVERKDKVVSREEILQKVWGYDVYPTTRTIDNFILAFRKYFEKDPRNPQFFHSVRGVGYKFINSN